MEKLMLIVNPYAGRQQSKEFLLALVNLFYQHGFEVTVFPTQCKETTIESVRTCAPSYDLIVCCGGDGTLSEVISGLMGCSRRPPLGYVPCGTTNDLAASLGIPKDPLEAGRAILTGEPFPYDIGAFNDRYFAYVAAFGAFTEVSYQTPQPLKNTLGHLAYILEGMKRLPEIHPYRLRITHDDEITEGAYVFGAVTNSTSVAGLFRLREDEVALSDGLLEVMLIKAPQNMIELQKIIAGLYTQNYDDEYVIFFHTSRLTVESPDEPIAWSLDGEDGKLQDVAEIRNLQRSISFRISGPPTR